MKPFEYYLKEREINIISKNINLAKSLIKDMQGRIKDSFSIDKTKFKIIFENIYDGLRTFCDALLAKDGYKSYSHEGSISYLSKYNFSISEIIELDNLRHARNGSKYYARIITEEDVKNIKAFYLKIKNKIDKIIKENNLE